MKNILVVVGTRPNFIKVTRFRYWAAQLGFNLQIVHTGQHYDANMAEVFFRQLHVLPDHYLEIPAIAPEQQVLLIQARLSKLMATTFRPDLVMVVGDVNSTRAGAEAAHIHNIPIAHVESGLRSFDQTMPEEINRIVADNLATYYFITEESGVNNLLQEGKPAEHLYLVGNTMIDTLVHFDEQIQQCSILEQLPVKKDQFVLMTMHRPSNVDTAEGLHALLECIQWITAHIPVVFPMHPRTWQRIASLGLEEQFIAVPGCTRTEPLDYFSFQRLIATCTCIVTDSGGIQEEATFRKKPCLTMRPNTERPVTISVGSNTLVPEGLTGLQPLLQEVLSGTYKKGEIPPLWDGHATERIFRILAQLD